MITSICNIEFLFLDSFFLLFRYVFFFFFFFSSRRRHTRYIGDWSSDVCSSDLVDFEAFDIRGLSVVPEEVSDVSVFVDVYTGDLFVSIPVAKQLFRNATVEREDRKSVV